MQYTIDAQGKKIGRVATEVAVLLMGKNRTDFVRNAIPDVKVKVINAGKVDVTNKKMDSETFKSYSGYPGGLKITTMKKLSHDKGFKEVVARAIKGMLPINKLRPRMMKNLTIEN